jgi:DNA-directed RNA polymerase subunit beta'
MSAERISLADERNIFDSISIRIASSDTIKSWSRGEVKKPETINYRTLKPEKDGLFCERIFGPTKDYECNCGKYKRIKHKGIICDRCGVEVTHSRVRRERMGHIELVSPCTHVWFFKVMPSPMAAILQMNIRQLERIIYYEDYVVTEPGETKLKKGQFLTEDEYYEAQDKYQDKFVAKMGAEAISDLLAEADLSKLVQKLRRDVRKTKSDATKRKLSKVLKIVDGFKNSGNNAQWMVLDIIPVIPPDLRPLVPLDGGRFATSDLNDLYRRVINRNNRLKKLLELKAPEVIIRNEKRMLQEAVDALFDNGRHGRPVLGAGNRPLKSLSDMLKGKQGRFRQNLLGKRVDYSGRSVIVIGPELNLHQCGLPKKMALELFEPFIIKKLKERGHVHTIKSAKRMVERAGSEVWDILDEVIKEHPVMLNRAPTLHRLGIQAFEPVLIEGKAIRIHPLVCTPFNADFDGDQMAVHVPLSMEAQMEARLIMLASNNIFSPANGKPIVTPTQDIVLGCYYLTLEHPGAKGEGSMFSDLDQVVTAYQDNEIDLQAKIKVMIKGELLETTCGRVFFNKALPEGFRYVNEILNKSNLSAVVSECYSLKGHYETIKLLDRCKAIGFEYATQAGLSISVSDLNIPSKKEEILKKSRDEVDKVKRQYKEGIITNGERHNKTVDLWTHATDKISDQVFKELGRFNPIYMMADSGARGSQQQIRQLAGMRGLMAKPSGDILETPITANFREGLSVLQYFISTHGARKGLADTALKTADSGYLTRRLVDVAQDVIITQEDCQTIKGITVSAIVQRDEVIVSLKERIIGRTALRNIVDVITDKVIVKAGDMITDEQADEIEKAGIETITIRSPLTCEADYGICGKCYGEDLAYHRPTEQGQAVGIIAAQSIGEPGTQLTMRTFHIGGTASAVVEQAYHRTKNEGIVKYHNLKIVKPRGEKDAVVLNRNGQISINDEHGRELERYAIPQGSQIKAEDNKIIKKDEVFVKWDNYNVPILAEVSGKVKFEDIKPDVTVRQELNETTKKLERVVLEHKRDYHPQIVIVNEKNEIAGFYPLAPGAHIVVDRGQKVDAGKMLAKIPRQTTKTKDITGGLPRVAEIFEARRPKNPAIISEIDGVIELEESQKGLRKVSVVPHKGEKIDYIIPHGKRLNVYKGDKVSAGEQLTDGDPDPHDILEASGEEKLQSTLVNGVQQVYRLQGVKINDKHIEIIIGQMLRKVKIEDPGDSNFLMGELVDKNLVKKENQKLVSKGKTPVKAKPRLLGITKASLGTESFISAASFQETTRVLTEAAAAGRKDDLRALKENVIMGHLVPAGTGFGAHRHIQMELKQNPKKEKK